MEPDLRALLLELADSGADFVVVGGIAAVLQGVPMATFDLDIVHSRSPENVRNLLRFLERMDACSRLRPFSEKTGAWRGSTPLKPAPLTCIW